MSENNLPTQDAAVAVKELVETATLLSEQEQQAQGTVKGYEESYIVFVDKFLRASDEGANETTIRSAIQSDAAEAGVTPLVKSAAAIQNIAVLARLHGKEGPLPEGWVYRPDVTGPMALLEEEKSLASLVRAVRDPNVKEHLTKDQRKELTGKAVAIAIIDAATSKEEAIVNLRAKARQIVALAKENKAVAAGPKSADRYAKAMRGPANAILGALDDEYVDDPALVREILAEVKANIDAALAHPSLSV